MICHVSPGAASPRQDHNRGGRDRIGQLRWHRRQGERIRNVGASILHPIFTASATEMRKVSAEVPDAYRFCPCAGRKLPHTTTRHFLRNFAEPEGSLGGFTVNTALPGNTTRPAFLSSRVCSGESRLTVPDSIKAFTSLAIASLHRCTYFLTSGRLTLCTTSNTNQLMS